MRSTDRRIISVLLILPPQRPAYEAEWLLQLPDCHIRIIHPDYEAKEWVTTPLIGAFFGSTARLTSYHDLDEAVKWADIVVTIEVYSSTTKQAIDLCKKYGKQHSILVWELIAHHPIYSIPPYCFITKDSVRTQANIIAVTECAKHHLEKMRLRFPHIRVVYPGVRAPVPLPVDAEIPNGKVTIAFAGLLAPHKGLLSLIEIVQRLNQEGLPVHLVIAGQGPLRNQIPHESWITYKGKLNYNELSAMYESADIFCSLVRVTRKLGQVIWAEQFSYSVAEAMSHALPCVVTDVGALREVVGNDNFVIPENDFPSAYESIRRLVIDQELRQNVGMSNAKRAKHHFDQAAQALALRQALAGIAC